MVIGDHEDEVPCTSLSVLPDRVCTSGARPGDEVAGECACRDAEELRQPFGPTLECLLSTPDMDGQGDRRSDFPRLPARGFCVARQLCEFAPVALERQEQRDPAVSPVCGSSESRVARSAEPQRNRRRGWVLTVLQSGLFSRCPGAADRIECEVHGLPTSVELATCSVVACLATTAGSRRGSCSTQDPIAARLVLVATAVSVVRHSRIGWPQKRRSGAHNAAAPSASASRAKPRRLAIGEGFVLTVPL